MPQTLYLIDGHALAYRTYFALTGAGAGTSRWVTSAGEATAGVFGFTSVLLRILEQERPEYMAVAFDVGKTFRDKRYKEYKATREKMPDDLRAQLDRIRDMVDAFGFPILELEGYEADDVIGSIAKRVADDGYGVKIITGDKDLLQLVDKRIIVSLPGKQLADSKDYAPHDVFEFLGVHPEQVVDFKAMIGDKSDNIPGIPGIGEKTAASLLAEYKTLENIYANLDKLKPAQRQKFEDGREKGDLSYELSKIVTDLDIPFDIKQARTDRIKPNDLQELFRQLEFRSLLKRLATVSDLLGGAGMPADVKGEQLGLFADENPVERAPAFEVTTHIVDSEYELEKLAARLAKAKAISFDTETSSTNHMQADLVGISISIEPGEGYYIPVGHERMFGPQLAIQPVIEAIRGPFTDPSIPKYGHNLSFDYVMLARQGLKVAPLAFDSMVAEWVADSSTRNLGLKNLVWVRLNNQMTEIDELLGKGRKQITMAQVPVEQAAGYAAADSEVILRLHPILTDRIAEAKGEKLFAEIEMPLVRVLADMEMTGISLDTEFLAKMRADLSRDLEKINTEVYEHIGEEFNLNSTQQIAHVLFDRLKLPPPAGVRKTVGGSYSTSADILDGMRDAHPIVERILVHRELSKLMSTYIEALPQVVNPRTNRVHTSYNQAGTVTGRIASSDPNLQNIPIRTELGRTVRRAFIAAPGHLLLGVDYSQVELRIVAHIAQDEAMLRAFRNNEDIHITTAAAILGIPPEKVTDEQRRNAKAVNFGLIYGMSAFGLTRSSDLTLAEAENFVKAYFEKFPGVRAYIDNTKKQAAKLGYIETLLGRRRFFPGLKEGTNYILKSRLERESINSPIQGTAADIMKLAMLRVDAALTKSKLGGKMLLQVHDELVIEAPEDEIEKTAKLVSAEMSAAYELKVPLQTEVKVGKNWGQMKPLL